MIVFKQSGDFKDTFSFLEKSKETVKLKDLDRYGKEGILALSQNTPVDSGLTSKSWHYEIIQQDGKVSISFYNSNIQNGVPIAIILQYGHATRNGGWVEGRDYINPAIKPIFDKIVDDAWREVTKS